MTRQFDLFAAQPISGLRQFDRFLTEEEERYLIDRINLSDLAPFSFQGWKGKRLTTSFGWRYDFDHATFGPIRPLPDWILPFRDRAAEQANLEAGLLVQALLIRYDEGAGVGWHRDRSVYEHIVGISLGAPAIMRFRKRTASGFLRARASLDPRGAYHLNGEVRHDWEHSVAPLSETRWSITFRSLSREARAWIR